MFFLMYKDKVRGFFGCFFFLTNQTFPKLLNIFKRELDCQFYSVLNLWTTQPKVTFSF